MELLLLEYSRKYPSFHVEEKRDGVGTCFILHILYFETLNCKKDCMWKFYFWFQKTRYQMFCLLEQIYIDQKIGTLDLAMKALAYLITEGIWLKQKYLF